MAATIMRSKSVHTKQAHTNKKVRKVCVLAYDGLCTFEYALAVEIFANLKPQLASWYAFETIAIEQGHISGIGNVRIEASANLAGLQDADIIIIPGWRGAEHQIPSTLKKALLDAYDTGAKMISFCSGVFVLAQCGLLDGKQATTRERHIQKLKSTFPHIDVNAEALYVDEGQILTSAGFSASVDLCLHIIKGDYGVSAANTVAKSLGVSMQRSGANPAYGSRVLPHYYRGNIAPLLERILESLDEDWGVERMAKETHSSARTLQRRFKEATGHSPHMWVIIERIELAKDLLETTSLNVQQIADLTGLRTPETVRHHFKRITGLSPTRYRAKYNPDRQIR